MNLKNYTSSVPVETTIGRIEQFLVATGLVTGIGKEYSGRVVTGLVFQIEYEKDKLPLTVRIKADVEQCQEFFYREYLRGTKRPRKTKPDFMDQAARTAWKLQEDWVRVETSLIILKQRSVLQSFMACVWDGEHTHFERVKLNGYRQLQLGNG